MVPEFQGYYFKLESQRPEAQGDRYLKFLVWRISDV